MVAPAADAAEERRDRAGGENHTLGNRDHGLNPRRHRRLPSAKGGTAAETRIRNANGAFAVVLV